MQINLIYMAMVPYERGTLPAVLHMRFLHVSFQAIQNSVATSPRREDTPCWLDAQTLCMLLGE